MCPRHRTSETETHRVDVRTDPTEKARPPRDAVAAPLRERVPGGHRLPSAVGHGR